MSRTPLNLKDCEVVLGGELWNIKFVRRHQLPKGWQDYGYCDWDKRTIYVRKDRCKRAVVDTLIHEMRHAQHPVLFEAEDFVNRTSTEITNGLLATGII